MVDRAGVVVESSHLSASHKSLFQGPAGAGHNNLRDATQYRLIRPLRGIPFRNPYLIDPSTSSVFCDILKVLFQRLAHWPFTAFRSIEGIFSNKEPL